MLAMLIVQGGELPRIFIKSICHYIQTGFEGCVPEIDEVPKVTVRMSLSKGMLCWRTVFGTMASRRDTISSATTGEILADSLLTFMND